MAVSPELEALLHLLFGYADMREQRLKKRGLKLAHYTTADVAAQILLKRNIWMRNASSMNDYMEFTFGSNCLKGALRIHGERFAAALNVVRPSLCHEVLEWLGNADFNHQHHTYLTSLSEHRPNDDLGLLSMWRAYGGPVAGVTLVFNTDFLEIDSNVLSAWSSPVVYGEAAFLAAFEQTVQRLEQNPDTLRAVDPNVVRSIAFNALQFAILSTKHFGFREEREWRVIHGPREYASAWVQPTFETVRGKPEVVYHLPLENHEGMNLPEIDLNRLLCKVIIGPCQNPYQIASTFEDIMRSLGIEEPDKRIRISLIPLRQLG
jgi:hypothetical protein